MEWSMISPWQWILVTCLGVLVSYSFAILYRVYLHPLAGIPGPTFAKAAGWDNWFHAVSGDRHVENYLQHEKYGSVVRFTPNSISFNTPTALQDIYSTRKPNVVKSDWYRCISVTAGGYWSTITTIDRSKHAAKRRLLSHAFSDNALREMEPRVSQSISTWTDHLGAHASYSGWSSGVDMGEWTSYLIFDILADLCFGKSFETMGSEENRFLIHLVPQATKSWYMLGYNPFTQLLRRLLFKTPLGKIFGGQSFRDNATFRLFCSRALIERRKLEIKSEKSQVPLPHKDFFHHLLRGRDAQTGLGYAKGELEAESVLLVVAGSDSSSAALAACFFYLVRNEHALRTLTHEIRSAFLTIEEVQYSGSGLANLPYLRACIDESIRMTPPTPGHLPREVLSGGAFIDGTFCPEGTVVGVAAYSMHHNKDYFPDPFRYSPERWIVDPATGVTLESVNAARSAFCPFSAGSRGCIGKHLAYMQLSLALARAVWLFDIRAKPGNTLGQGHPDRGYGRRHESEYQVEDVFVARRDGPVVQFRKRN